MTHNVTCFHAITDTWNRINSLINTTPFAYLSTQYQFRTGVLYFPGSGLLPSIFNILGKVSHGILSLFLTVQMQIPNHGSFPFVSKVLIKEIIVWKLRYLFRYNEASQHFINGCRCQLDPKGDIVERKIHKNTVVWWKYSSRRKGPNSLCQSLRRERNPSSFDTAPFPLT